jgi:hypothetical protein
VVNSPSRAIYALWAVILDLVWWAAAGAELRRQHPISRLAAGAAQPGRRNRAFQARGGDQDGVSGAVPGLLTHYTPRALTIFWGAGRVE